MLPIRNISYLSPMYCSFREKCKKMSRNWPGVQYPLNSNFSENIKGNTEQTTETKHHTWVFPMNSYYLDTHQIFVHRQNLLFTWKITISVCLVVFPYILSNLLLFPITTSVKKVFSTGWCPKEGPRDPFPGWILWYILFLYYLYIKNNHVQAKTYKKYCFKTATKLPISILRHFDFGENLKNHFSKGICQCNLAHKRRL